MDGFMKWIGYSTKNAPSPLRGCKCIKYSVLLQNSSNTNRRCFSSKKRSGWCLGDKVHGCCIRQQPLFFGLIQAQFFFQQSNAFDYSVHALRSHSGCAFFDIFDLLFRQSKADFLGTRVYCEPSHFFLPGRAFSLAASPAHGGGFLSLWGGPAEKKA